MTITRRPDGRVADYRTRKAASAIGLLTRYIRDYLGLEMTAIEIVRAEFEPLFAHRDKKVVTLVIHTITALSAGEIDPTDAIDEFLSIVADLPPEDFR